MGNNLASKVDDGLTTVLEQIEVTDPIVYNVLIDQRSIEGVLIFEQANRARDFMRQCVRFAHSLTAIVLLQQLTNLPFFAKHFFHLPNFSVFLEAVISSNKVYLRLQYDNRVREAFVRECGSQIYPGHKYRSYAPSYRSNQPRLTASLQASIQYVIHIIC